MASDSGLHVAGNAIQAELPPTLSKPVPHGKPARLADCSYPPQDAATKPSDTDKDARRDDTDKDALRATSNPAHNAPGKLDDTDKDALRATSNPAQDAPGKLSERTRMLSGPPPIQPRMLPESFPTRTRMLSGTPPIQLSLRKTQGARLLFSPSVAKARALATASILAPPGS